MAHIWSNLSFPLVAQFVARIRVGIRANKQTSIICSDDKFLFKEKKNYDKLPKLSDLFLNCRNSS